MQKVLKAAARRNPLLLCMFILGLMAALVAVPYQFRSQAGGKQVRKGIFQQTASHEEGLENYDIRADKSAFEKLNGFRQAQGRGAETIADLRGEFVTGEEFTPPESMSSKASFTVPS